jgi:hypothetical protein
LYDVAKLARNLLAMLLNFGVAEFKVRAGFENWKSLEGKQS